MNLPPLRSERTKLLTQHPFVVPGPPLETSDGLRMAELRGSPSRRLRPTPSRARDAPAAGRPASDKPPRKGPAEPRDRLSRGTGGA